MRTLLQYALLVLVAAAVTLWCGVGLTRAVGAALGDAVAAVQAAPAQ